MAQISREQLETLRTQKHLRPKTQEDIMREALQSPVESLQQQEQSLAATEAQIKSTYAERWFNCLTQFAFKLVEQMNINLSQTMNEEEIKRLNLVCINAVTAAELLTEQLRYRETPYKDTVALNAPIPELLTAGLALIRQDIKAKLEKAQEVQGMSLTNMTEEKDGEAVTNLVIDELL